MTQNFANEHPIMYDDVRKIATFIAEYFPLLSISWFTEDTWSTLAQDNNIKAMEEQTGLQAKVVKKPQFSRKDPVYKMLVMGTDVDKLYEATSAINHMDMEYTRGAYTSETCFEVKNTAELTEE